MRRPASSLIASALLAALLAGCATSSSGTSDDRMGSLMVAPGKYVLFTCDEIVRQAAATATRARELEGLMARAGTDLGGQLVATTTYRPEYAQKRGELNELRNAAISKNCKNVPGGDGRGARASDNAVR